MAKVITVANQKGGVGKTTTVLCLGACLQEKGYKVLYIDLDKQCNASETLRADTDKKGAYELLTDRISAKECIQITNNGDFVISGSELLNAVDTILNTPKNSGNREYRLKEGLNDVLSDFDFIIVDTAPNLDSALVNALVCTDYLIIVSNSDNYSIKGINDLLSITEDIKKYKNNSLKIGGFLLAKYSARSNINNYFKKELTNLAKDKGTKVYKTAVRECIAIRESNAIGEHITTYAPKSNAYIDYTALTQEILKDMKEV